MAERGLTLLIAAAAIVVLARRVSSEPAGEDLVVVTLNTWHAGRGVEDGAAKIREFLLAERASVVALQETEGELARSLAASLGWWCVQSSGSAAVLSRHPVIEERRLGGKMEPKAVGARVVVGNGETDTVTIWSIHLHYDPYGPYGAAFAGLDREAILEGEREAGRIDENAAALAAAAPSIDAALAGHGVTIVAGDWNAPSHLDWIDATASLHGGLVIAWPTSVAFEEAGLRDSFREANPDPVAIPGATWSPLYPFHDGSSGPPEPQDRIDFIYVAGDVETSSAERVVRGNARPYPDQWSNDWPSDHAAVVTHLRARGASGDRLARR